MHDQSLREMLSGKYDPFRQIHWLLDLFYLALWLVSSPMALFFRLRGWGERALAFWGFWGIFIAVGSISVYSMLGPLLNLTATRTMALFALWFTGVILLGLYQNLLVWQRHRNGDYKSVSSYDRGRSYGWWFNLCEKEVTVQTWFEPGLAMLIGGLLMKFVDPIFGGFILVLSAGWMLREYWDFKRDWNHFLDTMDAQIQAERMQSWMGLAHPAGRRHPSGGNSFTRLLDAAIDEKEDKQDVASMLLGLPPQLQALANGHRNGHEDSSEGLQLPLESVNVSGGSE